ncbi:protein ripply2 [Aotus nancymaae]|uniref:protein ripply2 n=1 Tax=Aotus nancymaae TaxID=37293 RepID=UPI0030FE8EF4
MRLAGERGGEGANLSMCSRLQGLYKARVSDLLEPAKIAASRQRPSAQLCGAMETAGSAEGAESRAAARAAPDGPTRRGDADSGSTGFWRPWVDARGKKEEETPNHAAEAMSNGPGMIAGSGKLSQFRHPVR